ncbi:MAG: SUMF1/EgtB/PvdO family nonheme iron enzyme [Thermoflexales bacterium]|nr:SUMF1/EgtB/PvdO family nonheme iron enzyme [Thermoflexales bacterium]
MPAKLPPDLKRDLKAALLLDLDVNRSDVKHQVSERTRYRIGWGDSVSAAELADKLFDQAMLSDWLAILTACRERDVMAAHVATFDGLITRVKALASTPADLSEDRFAAYHERRIRHWRDTVQIDTRFVRLTLVQQQAGAAGPGGMGGGAPDVYTDLWALVENTGAGCLMILGEPGAGKSTLLRRLQFDMASAARNGEPVPVTFFVPLYLYPRGERDPRAWLAREWERQYSDLDAFETLVQAGKLWLLLDGLNELKREDARDLAARNEHWRDMLPGLVEHGNRVIVTRRRSDEELTWDGPQVKVQRVAVSPMSDDVIQEFLVAYLGDVARPVWKAIRKDPKLLDLFRTPYFLRMLTDLGEVKADGKVPSGRADLFTRGLRHAFQREAIDKAMPLLRDPGILTLAERERLRHNNERLAWQGFDLPHSPVVAAMKTLAFRMRRAGRRVSVETEQARAWIAHPRADDLLAAAADLGVLKRPDLVGAAAPGDQVTFSHELMQEYFAARQLAEPGQIGSIIDALRVPWKAHNIFKRWRDNRRRRVGEAGTRVEEPPLPTTNWEEIAPMAAEMLPPEQAEAFIERIAAVNLALAGRSAAAPGVRLSEQGRQSLQDRLLRRMQSERANLRSRVAVGIALGQLGDPRFERGEGPYGPYLLPPRIIVPSGVYTIGDNASDQTDERPAHSVTLQAFELAKFPVTNAEYRLFIDAGGYTEAFDWCWETEAAKAWRAAGTGSGSARALSLRHYRRRFAQKAYEPSEGNIQTLMGWGYSREDAESMFFRDDAQFEAYLSTAIRDEVSTEPLFWHDPRFSAPNQPVVGVTWHEARAYCAWLSAQDGKRRFRLPTEAEREAAARGLAGRRYAYGRRFDPTRAVVWTSGLDAPVPVGLLPRGDTPKGSGGGISDLAGNVVDWTSSLYTKDYSASGIAVEDPNSDASRALRGGSWLNLPDIARAAYRDGDFPNDRNDGIGFRLVCAPVHPL